MTAPTQRPLQAPHIALNVLLAARPFWDHDINTSTCSDWVTTNTDWHLNRDELADPTVRPAVISVNADEGRISITHTCANGYHLRLGREAAETLIPLTPHGIEHLRHLLPAVESHGLDRPALASA
ncbi:hypothetical protein OG369_39110 [Streptomyces sp. NBC_01221]|uniref:hypothetical protein n=1 Tax=Streptomyces sp. NBC_01221 TaxID=2903782 RepID=UPI002257B4AA|nr:hypothetical protein [Streptomyces sp. NBC_01221]MCX4791870.1 hypothetical protein [Streptomyces sp. NBC_01221]